MITWGNANYSTDETGIATLEAELNSYKKFYKENSYRYEPEMELSINTIIRGIEVMIELIRGKKLNNEVKMEIISETECIRNLLGLVK